MRCFLHSHFVNFVYLNLLTKSPCLMLSALLFLFRHERTSSFSEIEAQMFPPGRQIMSTTGVSMWQMKVWFLKIFGVWGSSCGS